MITRDLLKLITEKGTEIGKLSHRPNLTYHFRILDSPVVNAFAVPGGYIYLTRGILAQFNSEAELMGVLGHEMGHIAARHSASQQTKQTLAMLKTMLRDKSLAEEDCLRGIQEIQSVRHAEHAAAIPELQPRK